MSRLPPVEKFSLNVRKNIRDQWDNKKDEVVKTLKELLGEDWDIDVDLKQIYAYATSDYGKESPGSNVYEHFESNLHRIREFVDKYGDEGKKEINDLAHKHILTLDVDLQNRCTYGGAAVEDGKLIILFAPEMLSTNIGTALETDTLLKALGKADPAPGSDASMNAVVRTFIRTEWDAKIEETRKEVAEALQREDVKFNPNFEANYAKLLEESKRKGTNLDPNYWESNLAGWSRGYFEGLLSQLKWQKFNEDEMMREALNEEVTTGEFELRVVDKIDRPYCDWTIDDGKFVIRVLPTTWGTNNTDACENIADKL